RAGSGVAGWGGLEGEREGELDGRAGTGGAVDPDAPAVQFDEMPGDGEPQPGSGVGAGAIRLVEPLEDSIPILGGNAGAGVGYPDDQVVVFGRCPDGDDAAGRGELHRVVDQVDQDLLDALRVETAGRQPVGDLDPDIEFLRLGLGAEAGDDLLSHPPD